MSMIGDEGTARTCFTGHSTVLMLAAVVLVSISCRNNQEDGRSSVKFDQYYVKGEALFTAHCSNCHQNNGAGLGRVYPPLNESDFMDKNFEQVVCLIRNGKSGEMVVNGKSYDQPMPPFHSLTDLEIAEITTYIYNSWSHNRGLVDVKTVSRILEKCER